MKKLITILLMFAITVNAQIQQDKYYHASAGTLLAGATYTIGQYSYRDMNPIAPSLIAITGGTAKEFYDVMSGKRFSYNDLAWTALSGIATNIIIRAIWKPRKKNKDIFEIENEPLN